MAIDISKINSNKKENADKRSVNSFLNKDISFNNKLKAKDKQAIYKDLSVLLAAGVDFKTALEILSNQQKKEFIKNLLLNIQEEVISGKNFHEALEATNQFTPYEYFSIKIGEETKKLELVLLELHKYYQRQIKLKKQIISVITYPAFVLVLTIGVLYFMLNYVVPMFKSVFQQFDSELPELTKKIIALSENFTSIVVVFIGSVLMISFLLNYYKNNTKLRNAKAAFILKIPFFGSLIKTIYLARFCQFLDLLLSSKTPLTEALEMVKQMIGFYPIENSITPINKDIIKGISFAASMKKHKIYDYKLTSMVAVAEEINELDSMFSRLADEYDEEVEHKTKMIGVILEPLIIIIIGGIVGLIMVAMYSPMFDLSKIINK